MQVFQMTTARRGIRGVTGARGGRGLQMTKRERFKRWLLGHLVGVEGLRMLDDAEALRAMRDAHAAYERLKLYEAQKEASDTAMKLASDDLEKALANYRKLNNLPASIVPEFSGFGRAGFIVKPFDDTKNVAVDKFLPVR